MSFSRSVSGLGNLPLFHNSEVVVFVEGDRSISGFCHDVSFWTKILQSFGFEKKFHVKQLGSKREVLKQAQTAHENMLHQAVYFADRDLDDAVEKNPTLPCLFFSHGRSFEADTLAAGTSRVLCNNWLPAELVDQHSETFFDIHVSDELSKLKNFCRAEVIAHIGGAAIWKNASSCRGLAYWHESSIFVDRTKIRAFLQDVKKSRKSPIRASAKLRGGSVVGAHKNFTAKAFANALHRVKLAEGVSANFPDQDTVLHQSIVLMSHDLNNAHDAKIHDYFKSLVSSANNWCEHSSGA